MKYASYENHKPGKSAWLNELPNTWDQIRGRFVLSVNPPSHRARRLNDSDEVSFVPMEAVGEYGGLNLDRTRPLDEIGAGYTAFEEGDVIVAKITPCFENGKGAIAHGLKNGVGFGTTELHVLRTRERIDKQFLFYLTISHTFRMLGESEMYGAGGQKRVPPDFAKDFRIPLPSLEEQEAITRFLDTKTAQINELIAKKRQLVDKLKEKRQALIVRTVTRGLPPGAAKAARLEPTPSMLNAEEGWIGEMPASWKAKKGRHLGRLIGSFAPAEEDIAEDDGGVPYAKVDDLNSLDSSLRLNSTKVRLQCPPPRWNTIILFPKRGAAIFTNKVALAQRVAFDSNLMGWEIHKDSDPKFVAYCLIARRLDDLADVSTVPQINNKHIYPAKFPHPPKHVQEEIVAFLDSATTQIDQLVRNVEGAIARLTEYRQALITSAVTGKIDVREVV